MSDVLGEDSQQGLEAALKYPLFSAMFNRRSRRISVGLDSVPAGTMTYTADADPQPLSPLEEAMLIAATGGAGAADLPAVIAKGPITPATLWDTGGLYVGLETGAAVAMENRS